MVELAPTIAIEKLADCLEKLKAGRGFGRGNGSVHPGSDVARASLLSHRSSLLGCLAQGSYNTLRRCAKIKGADAEEMSSMQPGAHPSLQLWHGHYLNYCPQPLHKPANGNG